MSHGLNWEELEEPKIAGTIWSELTSVSISKKEIEELSPNKNIALNEVGQKSFLDVKRRKEIKKLKKYLPEDIQIIKEALIKGSKPKSSLNPNGLMTREQIQLLLRMLPTDEQMEAIKAANVDGFQLNDEEKWCLEFKDIEHVLQRCELWIMKNDFTYKFERALRDLESMRTGITELRQSSTFRYILQILRKLGSVLNDHTTSGFNVDFLSRLNNLSSPSDGKTLLHHVCRLVMKKYPKSGDLFSELKHFVYFSKIADKFFSKNEHYLYRLVMQFNQLNLVLKQKLLGNNVKRFQKTLEDRLKFYEDALNDSYSKFVDLLLYLGYSDEQIDKYKVVSFFKMIRNFADDYRITRNKILGKVTEQVSTLSSQMKPTIIEQKENEQHPRSILKRKSNQDNSETSVHQSMASAIAKTQPMTQVRRKLSLPEELEQKKRVRLEESVLFENSPPQRKRVPATPAAKKPLENINSNELDKSRTKLDDPLIHYNPETPPTNFDAIQSLPEQLEKPVSIERQTPMESKDSQQSKKITQKTLPPVAYLKPPVENLEQPVFNERMPPPVAPLNPPVFKERIPPPVTYLKPPVQLLEAPVFNERMPPTLTPRGHVENSSSSERQAPMISSTEDKVTSEKFNQRQSSLRNFHGIQTPFRKESNPTETPAKRQKSQINNANTESVRQESQDRINTEETSMRSTKEKESLVPKKESNQQNNVLFRPQKKLQLSTIEEESLSSNGITKQSKIETEPSPPYRIPQRSTTGTKPSTPKSVLQQSVIEDETTLPSQNQTYHSSNDQQQPQIQVNEVSHELASNDLGIRRINVNLKLKTIDLTGDNATQEMDIDE